jgi:DNA-binding PadR family transcriptional regulator
MSWTRRGTLSLKQIHKYIDELEREGLVEPVPPEGGETRGQPTMYRATAEGVRRYEEWLASQSDE